MLARVAIFVVFVVLLCTGFPVHEQSVSSALPQTEEVDTAMIGMQGHTHDGSADDHRIDEQPAQPYAEVGADLSELLPVRHNAIAPSRAPGWEGSGAVSAPLPPYLDGPQRPPDARPAFA